MLDVGFAELHNPLFLGGKNHGTKLDSHRYPNLKMQYDQEEKELIVEWQGHKGHVPSPNVAYYVPGKPINRKVEQVASPMIAGIASAQVETPQSHVQAGFGHGQTGQKPIKK